MNKDEYQKRRLNIQKILDEKSIAIIPAGKEVSRNGDAHYRFRQNSDFYYLTGYNEPNGYLILTHNESILFNRPNNPLEEIWMGKRLGQDGAVEHLGVDKAYDVNNFESELEKLLANTDTIYMSLSHHPELLKKTTNVLLKLNQLIRKGIKSPTNLKDLDPIISELRLIKTPYEIELMRTACNIAVNAHKRAMRQVTHLENEYQLEAELLYEFHRHGCRYVAYEPIVGSGQNACTLHYGENNQPLKKGDLVLIDAGGEYHNYAADITRTFPISGYFSPEQKIIYELVLKAQKAAIDCVAPGRLWSEMQETIVSILTEGLIELGILKGSMEDLIEQEAYKSFYMHNSGHWLGLDVHDVGTYKVNNDWRPLKPGMVLTVEPGLYISPEADVDEKWRGIGVRIEDDVLVTHDGFDNLTSELPVEINEIEALIRG